VTIVSRRQVMHSKTAARSERCAGVNQRMVSAPQCSQVCFIGTSQKTYVAVRWLDLTRPPAAARSAPPLLQLTCQYWRVLLFLDYGMMKDLLVGQARTCPTIRVNMFYAPLECHGTMPSSRSRRKADSFDNF
jgi:hypothetical protein